MSRYEDYGAVAPTYDETRIAIGVEILCDSLRASGEPLRDLRLLDAGCGSGAYAQVLAARVGYIAAIDLNDAMLSVARRKLAREDAAGRIAFHKGSIEALPFGERAFDAAMINQVLHHLEDGGDDGWPGHRRVLSEIRRVLRPGGVLVVNMCTHTQLRDGFWYYDLAPAARDACIRRHIPPARFRQLLAEAGFEYRDAKVPLDEVIQGAAYFDPTGPLRERWRKGDSFWALATADQIALAEARVREMKAAGTLSAWFTERDRRREKVGQVTFFEALRA
ncbi:MAG: class I SAM-dependent methyltransferase [Rhodospirillales bacterium]|nr:MAG: class I SAM-dependent methyltransferase [Rhodospirillales bacterium]